MAYLTKRRYNSGRDHGYWLTERDRNRRYFHVFASQQRRIDEIIRLQGPHKQWVGDKDDLQPRVC